MTEAEKKAEDKAAEDKAAADKAEKEAAADKAAGKPKTIKCRVLVDTTIEGVDLKSGEVVEGAESILKAYIGKIGVLDKTAAGVKYALDNGQDVRSLDEESDDE